MSAIEEIEKLELYLISLAKKARENGDIGAMQVACQLSAKLSAVRAEMTMKPDLRPWCEALATKRGWKEGGESCIEFLMRWSYENGIDQGIKDSRAYPFELAIQRIATHVGGRNGNDPLDDYVDVKRIAKDAINGR